MFEARQDVIANRDRIGNVFESQAVFRDRLETEEVRLAAGREHQEVVGDRARVRLEPALHEIDGGDFHHAEIEILLAAQDGSNGLGDLFGLESRGGDLIEQRLEEMVVVAIEENYLHRRAAEGTRHSQAAKARAHNDDYPVSFRHNAASGSK